MKLNRTFAGAALASLLLALAPQAGSAAVDTRQSGRESAAAAEKEEGGRGGFLGKIFGRGGGGQDKKKKKEGDTKRASPPAKDAGERLEPDDTTAVRPDVPESTLANRREGKAEDEESEVVYYNNFMTSYRLGPEDVISVAVFGLDRYSKPNITVPPDGKIDYYFVRGGLHVAGKTTQQVADEITHHLDEYIIGPKVTVSLEKAMSARYYVIGDVAQPGIRTMTRRLSAWEAIMESGGVLSTGDKSRVTVARRGSDGVLQMVPVNIAAIERGRAPDSYFLRPGDMVIVPGNRFKTVQKVLSLLPVINFFRIFTGGL